MIVFLLVAPIWEAILGFLNNHYDWLTCFKDWSGVAGFSFSGTLTLIGGIQNKRKRIVAGCLLLLFAIILGTMLYFLPDYRRSEIEKILTEKVAAGNLVRSEITRELLLKNYKISEIDDAIDSFVDSKKIQIFEGTQTYPMSGGNMEMKNVRIEQITPY